MLGALILTAATMLFSAPSSQASMAADNAARTTIGITNQLSRAHQSVTPGTPVTWVNRDDENHRIKSDRRVGVEFDSGVLEPGERFSHTFRSVGDVTYRDALNHTNASYFGMVMVAPAGQLTATTDLSSLSATPAVLTGSSAPAKQSLFSAAAPGLPSHVEVEIHNKNEFRPDTVTIAQGGTVEWYNDDSHNHTVTGAGGIDSGDLDRDQRYSKRFNQPGTYDYVCIYHEEMQATVRVADANGNVPPPKNDGGGSPPPPGNGGQQVAVSIGNNFSPANVTLPAGSVVTWTNNDSAPHTATGTDFDSGMLTTGQKYSHTFHNPGTYNYVCAYHDNMTGSVRVTNASGDVPPPPGDGGGGGNPPPPPGDGGGGGNPPPPPGDGGSAPAPKQASVQMGDDFFRPGNVTVAVGGTVTWTNTGDYHTVTADDRSFDSGEMAGGDTFRHTFATAGSYRYVCAYHDDMTGTVTVTDGSGTPPPPDDGDNPPPPGNGGNPPPPGDGGGGGDRAPARASVAMGDDYFRPATVTIRPGGTVTWTNRGGNPHTATATDGSWDSSMVATGRSWSKKFPQAGRYRYLCAYHDGMTGTVVVKAAGKTPSRNGGGNGGGSGGPGGGPGGGRGGPGGSGGGGPSPGAQTHTVTMSADSFSPSVLTARVGDTVVFKNASSLPHNVNAGSAFKSPMIMGGQSYDTVLRQQGTINYKCDYHTGMTGTLKVAAAPAGTKLPPPSADTGLSGGSGSSGGLGSPSGSSGSSSSGGAPAPGAESHTITMVGSAFDPQVLQARVGDEVTWVNEDPIPHDVTGGPLDSGMMMGGDEYTTVLTEEGTIEYECTLHPGMTGTLEVGPALPGTEVPPASSSTTTSGGSGASDHAQTPSAEPEEGSQNHKVEIVNFLYEPDPLEVNVGDTVTFVNKDAAPHTATADDKSWDSGNLDQGDEWTLEAEKVGEIPYFCIYHPDMTGTLIVKPQGEETAAPAASSSADDTASTSAGQIAGFSSGWLALLAFLAGLQLQSRSASRRPSNPV